MKIVVLDGYTENPGDLDWACLEAFGEVTVYDRTDVNSEDEIISRIGDAEVVVTNKTPVTRRVLDACRIRFIAVLATGYNVVDGAYAREKGIPVSNVPAYGTAAVGQFAIALLLEICHHIGHHDQTVKAGKWQNCQDWCYWDYPLMELDGKTMGIIGFGRIGQTTGRIAKALGMRVVAYDKKQDPAATTPEPCVQSEGACGAVSEGSGRAPSGGAGSCETDTAVAEYVTLDQLLAVSDVIALHCPLFADTEGIINRETIGKMKDGVILINNSRGPLIVEKDLAEALNCGKVRAAGLDVVSTEPIKADNPLLTAKNCIITPHISWASRESRQRIMDCTADNIRAWLSGAPVNVVNG